MAKIGLIILAGGKSRRMGRDKGDLPWRGKTFLTYLKEEASQAGFNEVLVIIKDDEPGHGPMGGLATGMRQGDSDYYAVVSVDMPFYSFSAALKGLGSHLPVAGGAVIPIANERLQPLAGIYHRACLPVVERLIQLHIHKMRELLKLSPVKTVDMEAFKGMYMNVNTPADYRVALFRDKNLDRRIPVVSFASFRSKTGKTTVIESVLPWLQAQGLRVGVVKSDGHGFKMDHEGSDTARFMAAGAKAVGITSQEQYAIIEKVQQRKKIFDLAQQLDVDLVLMEGRRSGSEPVIELWRPGYSEEIITPENKLAAIIVMGPMAVLDQSVLKVHADLALCPEDSFCALMLGDRSTASTELKADASGGAAAGSAARSSGVAAAAENSEAATTAGSSAAATAAGSNVAAATAKAATAAAGSVPAEPTFNITAPELASRGITVLNMHELNKEGIEALGKFILTLI